MMKKSYEKPAFIMERFDTGEVICSDSDSEFCQRVLRAAEKAKKAPSSCVRERGGKEGSYL